MKLLTNLCIISVFILFVLLLPLFALAQERGFHKENRDKKYEFFGRDGKIYDSAIEHTVYTIPTSYGRLVSVQKSSHNPKERELWFEANDGVVRRVILVPIRKRKPPYLIYQEVIKFERD